MTAPKIPFTIPYRGVDLYLAYDVDVSGTTYVVSTSVVHDVSMHDTLPSRAQEISVNCYVLILDRKQETILASVIF
jgi:hypothetical protein